MNRNLARIIALAVLSAASVNVSPAGGIPFPAPIRSSDRDFSYERGTGETASFTDTLKGARDSFTSDAFFGESIDLRWPTLNAVVTLAVPAAFCVTAYKLYQEFKGQAKFVSFPAFLRAKLTAYNTLALATTGLGLATVGVGTKTVYQQVPFVKNLFAKKTAASEDRRASGADRESGDNFSSIPAPGSRVPSVPAASEFGGRPPAGFTPPYGSGSADEFSGSGPASYGAYSAPAPAMRPGLRPAPAPAASTWGRSGATAYDASGGFGSSHSSGSFGAGEA